MTEKDEEEKQPCEFIDCKGEPTQGCDGCGLTYCPKHISRMEHACSEELDGDDSMNWENEEDDADEDY